MTDDNVTDILGNLTGEQQKLLSKYETALKTNLQTVCGEFLDLCRDAHLPGGHVTSVLMFNMAQGLSTLFAVRTGIPSYTAGSVVMQMIDAIREDLKPAGSVH